VPFFRSSSWATKAPRLPVLPRCGACGLLRTCLSPKMPVRGRGLRKVLFVGEAPGKQEDEQGEQFVGAAGQVLQSVLDELDVDLNDCWKTNAVACRPPKNEIDDQYIESCRPLLVSTIRELKPSVIILLGMSAIKSLIGLEWTADMGTLGRWLGWLIPSPMFGAWLCPTYHPSYINRMNNDAMLRQIMRENIRSALELERAPLTCRPMAEWNSMVTCVLDGADARMRLFELSRAEGTLAFDYETTGLKPDHPDHRIVSAGFCLNGVDTFACAMTDDLLPILSKVLLNGDLSKIAANLKFEERWTRAKLGHGVMNWGFDTMLATHVLDNRSEITGLKFQAYVRLGVPPYNTAVEGYLRATSANAINRISQVPIRELLLYNGLDALFEYQLASRQLGQLCHH